MIQSRELCVKAEISHWFPWFQTALLSVRQLGYFLCSPRHIQCCWRLQVKPECWNVGLLWYFSVKAIIILWQVPNCWSLPLLNFFQMCLSPSIISLTAWFGSIPVLLHVRGNSRCHQGDHINGLRGKGRAKLTWSGRGFHTWPVTESHSITVEIQRNHKQFPWNVHNALVSQTEKHCRLKTIDI